MHIDGLDGGRRVGGGPVTDRFTVSPPDASCRPIVRTAAVTAGDNGQRTLTASLAGPGAVDVTVVCSRIGYSTAIATTTLTALTPVSSLTITGDGDECRPSDDALPDGVDALVECIVPVGGRLLVRAVAQGASARVVIGWSARAGASVHGEVPGPLDASLVGDTVVFSQTASAALRCTKDASVDVSAKVAGTALRTVRVAVKCAAPVRITAFAPTARNGPGLISGTLDVVPADASCRASNAGGIAGVPSVGRTGSRREVAVTVGGTGDIRIAVRCTKAGLAAATATQTFTARTTSHCRSALGSLTHGTQSVVRTLTSDARCVSAQRLPMRNISFHARWHTFTLDAGGWVMLGLEPAASGDTALDTYLMLLEDHGSGGEVLHRHNNLHGDATRLDDIWLDAGDYTVEATTALSDATGSYRLTVGIDQDPRTRGLPAAVNAFVGHNRKLRFAYQPTTAMATAQTLDSLRLHASVTAVHGAASLEITPQRTGSTTLPVSVTHAGRTTTRNITVTAACPPRHTQSGSGTCTPQDTYLAADCVPSPLHGPRAWGRLKLPGRYRDYAATSTRNCPSLTHAGRAKYHRFVLRHNLPVLLQLSDEGGALSGLRAGGSPSLSLWRYKTPTSTSGDEYRALRLIASVGTESDASILIERTLPAGTYLIETAPSQAVTRPAWGYELLTELPTAQKTYADVRNVGNTGLGGTGMTLGAFLDARGSLIYGAHPDADETRAEDPFYPESPNYPWLPFTTDRCSIPAGNWPIVSQVAKVNRPGFGGGSVP